MLKKKMINKNFCKVLIITFSFLMLLCFTFVLISHAQDYWTAMPPYNTLWPLWSPALSPVNAVIGAPVPIVTSLTPSTTLSVEPALTWDPSLSYPWLLYNTPAGLAYYDPFYGANFWPANSLIGSSGAALPLELPVDYALLPPTESAWLQQNVFFANTYFLGAYPSLLQSADPSLILAGNAILPAAVIGALTLGISLPTLGTTILPPPGINTFLTPAGILGW